MQNAKIATLGERVEDVFFVTDADNQPLSDPQLCLRLQRAIIMSCSRKTSSSLRRAASSSERRLTAP